MCVKDLRAVPSLATLSLPTLQVHPLKPERVCSVRLAGKFTAGVTKTMPLITDREERGGGGEGPPSSKKRPSQINVVL